MSMKTRDIQKPQTPPHIILRYYARSISSDLLLTCNMQDKVVTNQSVFGKNTAPLEIKFLKKDIL